MGEPQRTTYGDILEQLSPLASPVQRLPPLASPVQRLPPLASPVQRLPPASPHMRPQTAPKPAKKPQKSAWGTPRSSPPLYRVPSAMSLEEIMKQEARCRKQLMSRGPAKSTYSAKVNPNAGAGSGTYAALRSESSSATVELDFQAHKKRVQEEAI